MPDSVWTKELVQEHAQTAMAVELYTIPFYTTVMTSIIDTDSNAYKIIQGVLIEEMMHLQLVANLCLALDTIPAFRIPVYNGGEIPFLKPYDPGTGTNIFLQAKVGPLDAERIKMMLAIETPEEIDPDQMDHDTPQYPYSSIGEMYDALLVGIGKVGVDKFSWNTTNQRAQWGNQGYPQIITTVEEAKEAVEAIKAQGEGCPKGEHVTDIDNPDQFKLKDQYQMVNTPPSGSSDGPFHEIMDKKYSHYGRFLKIQKNLPDSFTGTEDPHYSENLVLQRKFTVMLAGLNALWARDAGDIITSEMQWNESLRVMRDSVKAARGCWEAGIIPDWDWV